MEKGKNIEKESFRIIDKLVDLSDRSEQEKIIVRRLVHTTGDVTFADTVRISETAIDSGIKALKMKLPIICDVSMVQSGITEQYTKNTGIETFCFISQNEVVNIAQNNNKTRAESAIEYASERFYDGIYAIGNAPTALIKLIELCNQNMLRPSLVVAFPVGFVKADVSKEVLLKTNIPFITNVGTKGGSACSATVVNALLRMAFPA